MSEMNEQTSAHSRFDPSRWSQEPLSISAMLFTSPDGGKAGPIGATAVPTARASAASGRPGHDLPAVYRWQLRHQEWRHRAAYIRFTRATMFTATKSSSIKSVIELKLGTAERLTSLLDIQVSAVRATPFGENSTFTHSPDAAARCNSQLHLLNSIYHRRLRCRWGVRESSSTRQGRAQQDARR